MGHRVVGIDAGRVASGAAGRNGGILRPGVAAFHHDAIRALGRDCVVRIFEMTMGELRRFADHDPGTVVRTGLLRLAGSDTEYADCMQQRDEMLADGLRAAAYTGPLGRGVFLADGGTFQPIERCRTLARNAAGAGARLFEQSTALSIVRGEVGTQRGRIRCASIVVAVDGRLEALLPELEGQVRTARLQMLASGPDREVALPCPVSLNYGFDYAQQLRNGCVVLGGGRDGAMQDEWTHRTEPTQPVQDHLDRLLRGRFGVRAPITHRWGASASYSTTGLPVLAEVRAGVWVIGAYSGTGNLLGALAGRAVARTSCGERCEFASLLAPPHARAFVDVAALPRRSAC